MRQPGMKKERNRMKKAQSRKREPFRIYRASITVEAALLYPILIFLLMFLLQKTITYYQQTDQAAQGIISVEEPDTSKMFWKLIVSIEHFIFFQFIAPPDFLNNTMTQAIVALKNADFNSEVIEAISRTNFTPIHMAIQGIFNNIFYGIILSIPVAALVCRKQTASPVSEEK